MVQEFDLQAESELRIELASTEDDGGGRGGDVVSVLLLEGSAEVFGVPLAEGKAVAWRSGAKVAVFTWYGCKLRVHGLDPSGAKSMAYVSEETPLVAYVNTHAQLEARRDHAAATLAQAAAEGKLDHTTYANVAPHARVAGGSGGGGCSSSGAAGGVAYTPSPLVCGPRVLVCGAADCGKSSLAHFLLACAARLGRCPLYLELDPDLGELGAPGTLGAAAVNNHSLQVHDRFEHTPPLLVWYGAAQPTVNPALYGAQVRRLTRTVDQRLCADAAAATAGFVCNTPAGADGNAYKTLLTSIQAVRADVVLVVGHDRLYQQLRSALPAASVAVVKLPRSGGVSLRDSLLRRQLQSRRVRDYFYGPQQPLPNPALTTSGAAAPAGMDGGSSSGESIVPALKPHLLELPLAKCRLWQWRPDASLDDDAGTSGLKPVTGKAGKATSSSDGGNQGGEDEASWLSGAVLERVEPSGALLHCLAAVLHLPATAESGSGYGSSTRAIAVDGAYDDDAGGDEALGRQLAVCSAAGYVVVQDVNLERGTLSLLAPCPGKLPSTDLVLGSALKWVEG